MEYLISALFLIISILLGVAMLLETQGYYNSRPSVYGSRAWRIKKKRKYYVIQYVPEFKNRWIEYKLYSPGGMCFWNMRWDEENKARGFVLQGGYHGEFKYCFPPNKENYDYL